MAEEIDDTLSITKDIYRLLGVLIGHYKVLGTRMGNKSNKINKKQKNEWNLI